MRLLVRRQHCRLHVVGGAVAGLAAEAAEAQMDLLAGDALALPAAAEAQPDRPTRRELEQLLLARQLLQGLLTAQVAATAAAAARVAAPAAARAVEFAIRKQNGKDLMGK